MENLHSRYMCFDVFAWVHKWQNQNYLLNHNVLPPIGLRDITELICRLDAFWQAALHQAGLVDAPPCNWSFGEDCLKAEKDQI